ncbi:hypothetical protein PoB_004892300 [Plakobranchus ocellatus]|uniref:Uncharacterized protein n=1 Tax=Plakobranchus ocellatus TaxID=259542 RepID=A0AAV4BS25_9GAST|nr:hypothetical protein PoB_004892300 [Plakobranchus ocellatus]
MCFLSTLKKVLRFQNQLARTQIKENAGTYLKKELCQGQVKNFVLWHRMGAIVKLPVHQLQPGGSEELLNAFNHLKNFS